MTALRSQAYGSGAPVTLVVPGLGSTAGEARIAASGIPGTRVVVTWPGHAAPDGTAAPTPDGFWEYGRLADEVDRAAAEVGATRAVGVSLGAGALSRLAATDPSRFERLVLMLPAALDRPRESGPASALLALADAVDDAAHDDGARLRELVADDLPISRDRAGDYVEQRAAALRRIPDALRALPGQVPVPDPEALTQVTAPVLVVAASGDPLHPEEAAKATAAAFGNAELDLVDSPAPMLTHRRDVRARLSSFLR